MRTIDQKSDGEFSVAMLVKETAGMAPNGMTLTQMRSRIRIIDAVEAAGETKPISLEDADFSTLVDAINSMSWRVADKKLLGIIDAILTAPQAAAAA